jgi:hypothetical protein
MNMQMLPNQNQSPIDALIAWFRELLNNTHFYATEAQSGILALAFGAVLLAPADTFGMDAAYLAMAQLAPEFAWGLFIFMLGVAQIYAIVSNIYRLRRAAIFLLTCAWFFISFMLFWAVPASNGPYTYLIIALSSAWAYWRLSLRG